MLFLFFLQGAGDAFVGALAFYLSKYKGLVFVEMVKRANEIAAISVCGPGTQTSYPTVEKLPPALFDPPGVNSCPPRAPKPEQKGHQRSKSEERRRRISLPNDGLSSSLNRDGKERSQNDIFSKGQRRASNDEALQSQSNAKKTRGFFGRRRSEGCVNTRKQSVEQCTKANGEGEVVDGKTDEEIYGRRGSVPQVQGVSLQSVDNVGSCTQTGDQDACTTEIHRETMIDF